MGNRKTLLVAPAHLISAGALVAALFTDDVTLTGPFYVGLQLAGLITNVAAARAAAHRRARRTWSLMALGFAVMLVSTACFTAAGLITTSKGPIQTDEGWLTAGILARVLFTVILVAALLNLSHQPMNRGARWRLLLDSTTMFGGGLMLIWYFILGPEVDGVRGAYVSIAGEQAAIALGDLALIMAACTVLMRGASPAGRRPLRLLLLASLAWFASDFLNTITSLQPDSRLIPKTFSDVAEIVPLVFMVTAAAEQYRLHLGSHEGMAARRVRPLTWLPYVALVGGFALMTVAAHHDRDYPWFGLILGAGLMTFSVAARQFTVLTENRSLATVDVLTGLANRVRLHEVLDDLDQHHLSVGRKCAVMVIDLNDFKPVNDTLGHDAGDALLAAFAQVLRSSVRSSDTAARLGGDEFAVVLLDLPDAGEAIKVAQRILNALDTPFEIAERPVLIRASIGIAITNGETRSDELMREADLAMYEAKRERTVGWQLFVPGSSDARHEQARLRDDLRRAVDSGQLRVVYQPIIALASQEVIGFEALVRWQHPTRGLLTPDAFLPLAERTGIVHDIDFFVLQEACRQMGDWRAQVPGARGLRLNANLSAGQLKRANLAALVTQVLTTTGFDPRDLVLEITETSTLVVSDALAHVNPLRAHGVRIALDDFGTGHSSLEHLLRMPVDIIKLDRCFVAELNEEKASMAIAQAVVRLGHVLDLDTVAEGIETGDQARQMLELGYVYGQGYFFARPLAADTVPDFLVNWARSPLPVGVGDRVT